MFNYFTKNQPLGLRPDRCYGGIKYLYALNREKTGLNRAAQKDFFNIIEEPKFDKALNGDDDSPVLNWIVVPILHIVSLSIIDKIMRQFSMLYKLLQHPLTPDLRINRTLSPELEGW